MPALPIVHQTCSSDVFRHCNHSLWAEVRTLQPELNRVVMEAETGSVSRTHVLTITIIDTNCEGMPCKPLSNHSVCCALVWSLKQTTCKLMRFKRCPRWQCSILDYMHIPTVTEHLNILLTLPDKLRMDLAHNSSQVRSQKITFKRTTT